MRTNCDQNRVKNVRNRSKINLLNGKNAYFWPCCREEVTSTYEKYPFWPILDPRGTALPESLGGIFRSFLPPDPAYVPPYPPYNCQKWFQIVIFDPKSDHNGSLPGTPVQPVIGSKITGFGLKSLCFRPPHTEERDPFHFSKLVYFEGCRKRGFEVSEAKKGLKWR